MRRLLTVFGLVVVLTATGVTTVAANPPTTASAPGAPGRALGIVPVLDQARGARPTRTSNLAYHGGPVMQQNRTYAIFWNPTGTWDSGYVDTIIRYFGDVAADSSTGSSPAKTSNVYWSDTQYYDAAGNNIAYTSSFGGSYLDTTAYPSNGCTDKATSICLSDAQLRTELQNVMTANSWAPSAGGVQNLFFIFTPKGVGSCVGSSCAYTNFCAYHWSIPGTEPILYANQPYAAQSYRIYTCDSGQHPNNTTADATLNVVSHEHNEAITDELGTAWYDSQGSENGDKCAWNFGSTTTSNAYGKYNQLINGNPYYLQQEWSNTSSGCVLTGL